MKNIFDIANWFLTKEKMSHKKLQKLCYYSQAWHLALNDEKLIDSNFQAWVHGPVNYLLYNKYRIWGWRKIKETTLPNNLPQEVNSFLENVWETYGQFDGDQLEELTHSEMPWKNARQGLGILDSSSEIIKNDDMKSFYHSIYIGD